MSGALRWAAVFIVSALVCYTTAVWSERLAGELKRWHLGLFWSGLVADVVGTAFMARIAGGLVLNFHGLTGIIGILLMLIHTWWASVVLRQGDQHALAHFHKFSLAVWLVWLVPFFSGARMGMGL